MINQNNHQSTAQQPDLDWSQIRETVRMLHLAVAQIDMTLREGDDSVQTLSESFASMTGSINTLLKGFQDHIAVDDEVGMPDSVKEEGDKLTQYVQKSVVAFQFYDKLSQRLSHVSLALAELANLVNDQERLYKPSEWTELQHNIRSRYSMREEQEMFDHLLAGGSMEEALEKGMSALHKLSDSEEVELF